jgi:hypothetical protein
LVLASVRACHGKGASAAFLGFDREHDIAAFDAIEDRVRNQRYRLHSWVVRESVLGAFAGETGGARVCPDIGPRPSEATELDIVEMLLSAVSKQKQQFVLATVKRAHSGISFGPDDQIKEREFSISIHIQTRWRERRAVRIIRAGRRSGKDSKSH